MVDWLSIDLQIAVVLLILLGYCFVMNATFPKFTGKKFLFSISLIFVLLSSAYVIHYVSHFAPIAYAFFLVGTMRWGSAIAAWVYSPKVQNWSKHLYFVFSIALSMGVILFITAFY